MAEENGQDFAPEIKDIGDKIAALTVSKAVQLGNYLEKVHGIKPAAGGVAMVAPTGPAARRNASWVMALCVRLTPVNSRSAAGTFLTGIPRA